MATKSSVTYVPADDDAVSVEWYGVKFIANKPVKTENADLLKAAAANRFFTVKTDDEEIAAINDASTQTQQGSGADHQG